jgi:hypothetical protein
MISFYKDEAGVVMFKDDTYLATMMFVIDRPATDEDAIAHPDEHAAVESVAAPVEPESAPTVSPDGVA